MRNLHPGANLHPGCIFGHVNGVLLRKKLAYIYLVVYLRSKFAPAFEVVQIHLHPGVNLLPGANLHPGANCAHEHGLGITGVFILSLSSEFVSS